MKSSEFAVNTVPHFTARLHPNWKVELLENAQRLLAAHIQTEKASRLLEESAQELKFFHIIYTVRMMLKGFVSHSSGFFFQQCLAAEKERRKRVRLDPQLQYKKFYNECDW